VYCNSCSLKKKNWFVTEIRGCQLLKSGGCEEQTSGSQSLSHKPKITRVGQL
jgi:hypothetical protein